MNDTALAPLPWQYVQWQSLSERFAHDKLPHALLLHGAAGIGKGHIARLLALSLLCENSSQYLPCGSCHACSMFAAGSHPDFFLASTSYGVQDNLDDEDGKPRKAKKMAVPSKQIKIDCIRDLIHFSTHSAHQSGRRVALIEPAEWLNHNAANALLKTLEEPGEGLFIILVSHQPSRLLPTLRSRCQSLFCATPTHTQATEWLRHHISPERAETALVFSNGAPLKALAAVHAEQDLAWREVMLVLQSCRAHEITYLFAAESLAKQDAVMVLEWWLDLVHQQCKSSPEKSLLLFYDTLLAARRKALGTANPNMRMLFETLLIDWMAL
ncbi:MAG TPA: DNA polymerase III subunit delta' [Pseudomonadales bacterium]|nr:DNA polymerase III subunit delta' [Pseudomonadales bacterium]